MTTSLSSGVGDNVIYWEEDRAMGTGTCFGSVLAIQVAVLVRQLDVQALSSLENSKMEI